MSSYQWRAPIADNRGVAGAALTNTVTATSLLPATALVTIAGGALKVGDKFKVNIEGVLSNVVTAAPTLTLDVRIGSVSVFTAVMQLSTTVHTNVPFKADITLEVKTVGAGTSATILGMMDARSQAINLTAAADAGTSTPNVLYGGVSVGTGFDSTAGGQLDLRGTWSAANASNSVTINKYLVESVN
jgi:hypothetical protein